MLRWCIGLVCLLGGGGVRAAEVSPQVLAELKGAQRATVLAQVAAEGDGLPGFQGRTVGVCWVRSYLATARVAILDADAPCVEAMRRDPALERVELPGYSFLATAESLPLQRHETMAVVGAGLSLGEPELERVGIAAQACFGDCPYGPENAWAAGLGRTTERAIAAQVPAETWAGADALNLQMVAVRVGSPGQWIGMDRVLEALDWLWRTQPRVAAVVLSLESAQVFCGECEEATLANRALAAYVRAFRGRSVRVLAPDLGYSGARGAPACLAGVGKFRAAAEEAPAWGEVMERMGLAVGKLLQNSNTEYVLKPLSGDSRSPNDYKLEKNVLPGEFSGSTARGIVYTSVNRQARTSVLVRPQWSLCAPDKLTK